MSDVKNNINIYNNYLKSINEAKKKVRHAQNIKRRALKKDKIGRASCRERV